MPATAKPATYLQDPAHLLLRRLLSNLFAKPEPDEILNSIHTFLGYHFFPMEDFPRLAGSYARTILYRHENGYEAMAARWSKEALSSVHGHPSFVFYFVIQGQLRIDNYSLAPSGLNCTETIILTNGQGFHARGEEGRFDNTIHQVHADEETLSFHISSDDATKGAVFSVDEEARRGKTDVQR